MLKKIYRECTGLLRSFGVDSPENEAQLIIEKITGFSRAALIAYGDSRITEEQKQRIFSIAKKRAERIPLQYLLGEWEFCGLKFKVGNGVLIPRDDTEVAVNLCIDFLKDKPYANVIDLCAGSGAISVALSKLCNLKVTAVEFSGEAFNFLKENIKLNNADVSAIKDDILTCYESFGDKSFDLIVSNPPYIKSNEIPTLQAEVGYEPVMALDGGENGYDFYESIITNWSAKLKYGGALVFELGEDQADHVGSLMRENGFGNIQTSLDLGGIQRAIIGTMLKY